MQRLIDLPCLELIANDAKGGFIRAHSIPRLLETFRSVNFTGGPVAALRASVLEELERLGYRAIRESTSGQWRVRWRASFEGAGKGALGSSHKLDLKITDEDDHTMMLDFFFEFERPSGDPRIIHTWTEEFRERVTKRAFPELVLGTVSEDASRIVFDGPTPPYYHPTLDNFLFARSRRTRRMVWKSTAVFWPITLVFPLAYLLYQPEPALLAFAAFFMAFLPLSAKLTFVYREWARESPLEVLPTHESVKLLWRHREEVVPWTSITGMEMVTQVPRSYWDYAWHHQEYIVTWSDPKGRRRRVRVAGEVYQHLESGWDSYPHMKPDEEMNHLVWFSAPAGTKIAVGARPLTREEQGFRKVYPRFPRNGLFLVWYVSEDEDKRCTRENLQSMRPGPQLAPLIARQAASRGYWDIVEELWRQAVAKDPSKMEYVEGLSHSLAKQERTADARQVLVDYQAEHGPNSQLQLALALISQQEGDMATAHGYIGRAVELEPNDPGPLLLWFDSVAAEGGPALAVAELETVASADPSNWAALLVLGIRLGQAGSRAKAMEYFEQALSREENDETVGIYLGYLLQVDEGTRALALAERAMLIPERLKSRSWYYIGVAAKLAGRRDWAKAVLGKVSDPEWKTDADDLMSDL